MRSFSFLVSALVCVLVSAQKEPNLFDIANVMANLKSASEDYAHASQASGLTPDALVRSVEAANGAAAAGCVRDSVTGACLTSFLKSQKFAAVLRPLIARVMGATGPTGVYERKTQSPLVFLHLHHA
jgi:hypothetical protein